MKNPSSKPILVTGGAGYIGSHAVLALRDSGNSVVVLDNLSTGVRAQVPHEVPFVLGDVGDVDLVVRVLEEQRIDTVLHFAGSIVVPDSVVDPLGYYRNNTVASRALIEACVRVGVRRFVFSSTAAVYGEPDRVPIAEDAATIPQSPYGSSKLMTEWILRDVAAAHPFHYVALRYFNVAGADPDLRSGQSTPKATHLIKVASELVVGKRPFVSVFGEDYPTDDGTCVRDYIHVTDLAEAHVAAVRHLQSDGGNLTLNCGYGRGYSVRDVLSTVERVCGRRLDIRSAPRRPGDPSELVAESSAVRRRLQWTPRHDNLDFIVKTAIAWEEKRASSPVMPLAGNPHEYVALPTR